MATIVKASRSIENARRSRLIIFTPLLALAVHLLMTPMQGQVSQDNASANVSLLTRARSAYTGVGARMDAHSAATDFQQAAASGSVEAEAWLCDMYLHGRGITADKIKGRQMVTAAATAGDPVGLRFAGAMYEEGRAVPQDFAKARDCYEKAVAKGDVSASGRLGMLYMMGRGVPSDSFTDKNATSRSY